MMDGVKKNWYNASIRKKLMIFLMTIILCISVFSIYLLTITFSYINDFSSNVNEYFIINMLQQNNEKNERLRGKYFDDLRMDSLSEYNQSMDSFYMTFQELKENSHNMEAYLLIRSIQNSFTSYSEESNMAIRKQREGGKDFQINYYNATRINQYIDFYVAQLLEMRLHDGHLVYSRIVDDARVIMLITAIMMMSFLFFCIVFGLVFSNYLTKPIEQLAKLSMQISEGDLNVTQLSITSSDEVGIMATSFNKMSSSIRTLVYDLQEKALVEKKLHKEEMKNIRNQELLKEAKFLALQSQINPHFLFNTLNTVSRVVLLNRSDDAIKLINGISEILRYNMGNSKLHVTLEDELEIVKQYILIQQYRFGDRLKVVIDCSRIEAGAVVIPCFTLQPIIENSVIHGLEPKVAGGCLKIKAYMDKGDIVIKIIDNGVGMDEKEIKSILSMKNKKKIGRAHSIGLSNVMNRLDLFRGKKGSFEIKSKVNLGTIVIIRIPKKR